MTETTVENAPVVTPEDAEAQAKVEAEAQAKADEAKVAAAIRRGRPPKSQADAAETPRVVIEEAPKLIVPAREVALVDRVSPQTLLEMEAGRKALRHE